MEPAGAGAALEGQAEAAERQLPQGEVWAAAGATATGGAGPRRVAAFASSDLREIRFHALPMRLVFAISETTTQARSKPAANPGTIGLKTGNSHRGMRNSG